jgi:hypothetical protein
VGGCLLKVVQKRPNEGSDVQKRPNEDSVVRKRPNEGSDAPFPKLLPSSPATIRPEGSKRVTAEAHGDALLANCKKPRVCCSQGLGEEEARPRDEERKEGVDGEDGRGGCSGLRKTAGSVLGSEHVGLHQSMGGGSQPVSALVRKGGGADLERGTQPDLMEAGEKAGSVGRVRVGKKADAGRGHLAAGGLADESCERGEESSPGGGVSKECSAGCQSPPVAVAKPAEGCDREIVPGTPEESEETGPRQRARSKPPRGDGRKVTRVLQPGRIEQVRVDSLDQRKSMPSGGKALDALCVLRKSPGFQPGAEPEEISREDLLGKGLPGSELKLVSPRERLLAREKETVLPKEGSVALREGTPGSGNMRNVHAGKERLSSGNDRAERPIDSDKSGFSEPVESQGGGENGSGPQVAGVREQFPELWREFQPGRPQGESPGAYDQSRDGRTAWAKDAPGACKQSEGGNVLPGASEQLEKGGLTPQELQPGACKQSDGRGLVPGDPFPGASQEGGDTEILTQSAPGDRSPGMLDCLPRLSLERTRVENQVASPCPGVQQERPVSKSASREKLSVGPVEKKVSRWAELANYEVEETPPSEKSSPASPESSKDSSPRAKSSPYIKPFRRAYQHMRSSQKPRPASNPRVSSTESSDNSEGSSSEEEGRPRRKEQRPWSPPPPPSSDDDTCPADGPGKKSFPVQRPYEASDKTSGEGDSLLAGVSSNGNGAQKRRKGDQEKGKGAQEKAPFDAGRKERLWKSNSPETGSGRVEKRRLRKVGAVPARGHPLQGHCALPLFSRAQPGRGKTVEGNVGLEEKGGDSPGTWEGEDVLKGSEDQGGSEDSGKESGRLNGHCESPNREDGRSDDEEDCPNEHRRGLDIKNDRLSRGDGRGVGQIHSRKGPPWKERPLLPRRLDSLMITTTGYREKEKKRLLRMICEMGATYTKEMTPRNTHLVCWNSSGGKYQRAIEWGIPQVNHRWVEDCAWRNEVVPEEGYGQP